MCLNSNLYEHFSSSKYILKMQQTITEMPSSPTPIQLLFTSSQLDHLRRTVVKYVNQTDGTCCSFINPFINPVLKRQDNSLLSLRLRIVSDRS